MHCMTSFFSFFQNLISPLLLTPNLERKTTSIFYYISSKVWSICRYFLFLGSFHTWYVTVFENSQKMSNLNLDEKIQVTYFLTVTFAYLKPKLTFYTQQKRSFIWSKTLKIDFKRLILALKKLKTQSENM